MPVNVLTAQKREQPATAECSRYSLVSGAYVVNVLGAGLVREKPKNRRYINWRDLLNGVGGLVGSKLKHGVSVASYPGASVILGLHFPDKYDIPT